MILKFISNSLSLTRNIQSRMVGSSEIILVTTQK